MIRKKPLSIINSETQNLGSVSILDGSDVAQGTTTDAAVTTVTDPASVIAALKGIIKQLQGGGTGVLPVSIDSDIQIGAVEIKDSTSDNRVTVSEAGALSIGIADGVNVTQGAKNDAAVIDPTSEATTISVLKGILTDLGILTSTAVIDPAASANINALLKGIMTDIGPVAATAVVDPAASASIVAALKGLLTLIGSLTATAVIDPTASGSINANIKGLLKQLQGTGTGALPVSLSSDIEIGAVELKDGTTDNRAVISVAGEVSTNVSDRAARDLGKVDIAAFDVVGQAAMAASIPVTLASDQSDVKVTLDSETVTIGSITAGDNNIGNMDIASLPSGNLGQQAMAASLSVVPANNITDATYIGDIKFGESLPAGTNNVGDVDLASALSSEYDSIDVSKMSKGTVTTAHSAITGTATSNEIDCRGFNSAWVDFLVTAGAGTWTLTATGASASGGTFTTIWEEAGLTASDNFLIPVGANYIKITATETVNGATITVYVTPLNSTGVDANISQDIADIKTAIQTLDNIVSGSEAQCDIVTLPGTVAADITAIKTAIEILDNAISGSEIQADIVGSLPAGTAIMGQVGIDQTTDGTTNKIRAYQPIGSNTTVHDAIGAADTGDTHNGSPIIDDMASHKFKVGDNIEVAAGFAATTQTIISVGADSITVGNNATGDQNNTAVTLNYSVGAEIDCRGFNSLELAVTGASTCSYAIALYGSLTSGGTFGPKYSPTGTDGAQSTAAMTVTHGADDTRNYIFKGLSPYMKIKATKTTGTLTVIARPCVL